MAEDMHTKPRGQGGLPWHLRLNDLLGRARACALTDVGNRTVATLSRRVHSGGKTSQAAVRGAPLTDCAAQHAGAKRQPLLAFERHDGERCLYLARSA